MLRSISPAAYAVLYACCGETDLNKLQDALASPQYALILALMPGMDPSVRAHAAQNFCCARIIGNKTSVQAHAAQKANAPSFELLADALRAIPPDDADLIIEALPQAPPDRLKFAVIFTGLDGLFVNGRQSFGNIAQNAEITDICRLLRKLHQSLEKANYATFRSTLDDVTFRSTLEDMISVLGNSDAQYVWKKLKPDVRKRIIPNIDYLAIKLAANDQTYELSKILKQIEGGMPQLEAYDVLCALDTISDLSTLVMMPDDIRCAVIGVVIERMGIEFLRAIFHCLKDEKKKILRSDARVAIAVADLRA